MNSDDDHEGEECEGGINSRAYLEPPARLWEL